MAEIPAHAKHGIRLLRREATGSPLHEFPCFTLGLSRKSQSEFQSWCLQGPCVHAACFALRVACSAGRRKHPTSHVHATRCRAHARHASQHTTAGRLTRRTAHSACNTRHTPDAARLARCSGGAAPFAILSKPNGYAAMWHADSFRSLASSSGRARAAAGLRRISSTATSSFLHGPTSGGTARDADNTTDAAVALPCVQTAAGALP